MAFSNLLGGVGWAELNGDKTLGENIADNGGLKLAYKAYQNWLANNDENGPDSARPELGLNSDQLFFLSFAQNMCEMSTTSYQIAKLVLDVHSPNKFRVDGTLMNNPDFANAFSCSSGITNESNS
ncbi:hypothetical protein ACROYT_G023916 [Oculina patagonica]